MNPTADLYQFVDAQLARAVAEEGSPVTCRKGCFHCCKEAAYTNRAQIAYLLEGLSPDAIEELKTRTQAWLDAFLSSPVCQQGQPSAFVYRALNLWCPLLNRKDGTCSVYERRPLECRWFIARGPEEHCADDLKRPFQEFLRADGLVALVMRREVQALQPGTQLVMDHIGVLLAEALLGYTHASGARMVIRKTDADTVEMLRFAPDNEPEPEAA